MSDHVRGESVELKRPVGVKTFLVLLVGFVTALLFGQLAAGASIPVLLFTLLGLVIVARSASTRYAGAKVWLDEGALRVKTAYEELDVPFADIQDGYEAPPRRTGAKAAAILRLVGGNSLEINTYGREEAARILAHAGVAADQRVLRMPLRHTLGAFTTGLVTFFGTMLVTSFLLAMFAPRTGPPGSWYPLALIGTSVVATALFVMKYGYPRVVIGADGVRTEGVIAPGFVRYEDVEKVTLGRNRYGTPVRVRLHVRGRRPIDLPLLTLGEDHARAIVQRIEDARARRTEAVSLDALARGDRDVASWREELARIAVAEAGFRERAMSREDFERVLADASAPADQRVGAAIALRVADPEGADARVRVAAEATADEDLRAALLDQADDEALDRVTRRRRPDG